MFRRSLPLRRCCALVVLLSLIAACGDSARGPYAPGSAGARDVPRAEATYAKAMACLASDEPHAELLLREALGYDLYLGRAHNNLGVLLFRQGKLYEAAGEFEWARKLLPGLSEPRVNLALVLDQGGKSQEAVTMAMTALEVRPNDIAACQAIAMFQLADGTADASTLDRLQTIIDMSTEPEWVSWAKLAQVRLRGRLDQR